jgi:hypothetical protein
MNAAQEMKGARWGPVAACRLGGQPCGHVGSPGSSVSRSNSKAWRGVAKELERAGGTTHEDGGAIGEKRRGRLGCAKRMNLRCTNLVKEKKTSGLRKKQKG